MGKLYYCSTVWSNTSSSNIKKLQAVQNFACRIIANGIKFDHITPMLKDIEFIYWSSVECRGLNVEGEGKKSRARVKSRG
jgi:hypothetical protein